MKIKKKSKAKRNKVKSIKLTKHINVYLNNDKIFKGLFTFFSSVVSCALGGGISAIVNQEPAKQIDKPNGKQIRS